MTTSFALIWTPGLPEIILVLVVVLLLFGGKRLPGLARSLGQALLEFKKGLKGAMEDLDKAGEEPSKEKKPSSKVEEKGKKLSG